MEAIAYRHFNKIRNLGDSINPWLLSRLFDRPVIFAPELEHVLPVGSIFFSASPRSHIWGSGILDPEAELPSFEPQKVRAVRGRLTIERLRALGHSVPDVPLGDPGYLVADAMPPEWSKSTARYAAAVVPHHGSWNHEAFTALRGRDDIALVDMRTDDPETLRRLAESEIVISESLHGLIFGAALGKPVAWIAKQDTARWLFKFQDWFSVCRSPLAAPLPFEAGLESWMASAQQVDVEIDKAALRDAFPLEAVLHRVAGPIEDFDSCRKAGTLVVRTQLFEHGEPVFHPPDAKQRQLAAQVKEIAASTWKGRAYPTYVAIVPDGMEIASEDLTWICQKMDERGSLSFTSIVPRAATRSGPLRLDDNLRLLGGALVVRPNGRFDPAGRFATVEYPLG